MALLFWDFGGIKKEPIKREIHWTANTQWVLRSTETVTQTKGENNENRSDGNGYERRKTTMYIMITKVGQKWGGKETSKRYVGHLITEMINEGGEQRIVTGKEKNQWKIVCI